MDNGKFRMTKFDRTRPGSWSYFSLFEYDREAWYRKYVLGIEEDETPELRFGKALADSIEDGTCAVPGLLEEMPYRKEYPFNVVVAGMRLRGFADALNEDGFLDLDEVKSGVRPWTQKRVDSHGQIDMYCLMNYAKNRVRPEDMRIRLHWVPTRRTESGDFNTRIDFATDPPTYRTFTTRRTMADIANFTLWMQRKLDEMERFVSEHE